MNVREAYQTLELDYGASLERIDTAHRNLIRVWHPDRFIKSAELYAYAEEKTKRLNEARDVLRTAWSTGRLADDAGPESGSETSSNGYEDHQVTYLGHDPRLKPVTPRSAGTPAAVALTKFGMILATNRSGEIDEVIAYLAKSVRWMLTSRSDFLRSPDQPRPVRNLEIPATEVYVAADDPEGLVSDIILQLRFRNDYFAKLFVKRIVSEFGLQKPQTPVVQPAESDSIPPEMLIGTLVLVAVLGLFILAAIFFSPNVESTTNSALDSGEVSASLPLRSNSPSIGSGDGLPQGLRDPTAEEVDKARLRAETDASEEERRQKIAEQALLEQMQASPLLVYQNLTVEDERRATRNNSGLYSTTEVEAEKKALRDALSRLVDAEFNAWQQKLLTAPSVGIPERHRNVKALKRIRDHADSVIQNSKLLRLRELKLIHDGSRHQHVHGFTIK